MKIVIYTIYRPPDAANYGNSFEESLQKMKKVLTILDDSLHILLVDFSLSNVEWSENHFLLGVLQHGPRLVNSLLDLPNMLFME